MLNSTALREEIDRSGYKLKYVAGQLGLTYYGLKKKMDGCSEFKPSEILAMQAMLGLSDGKRDAIFLAKK